MPAMGSTEGINHCDNHVKWVLSGDAVGDVARAKGALQPPEPLTGYTCRCGGAWAVDGATKTIQERLPEKEEERITYQAKIAEAGGDVPAGHFRVGHHVFQRIGRGSLRDFLG